MTVYILASSVLLQVVAAIMAVRLIKVTGERVAWGVIATAITLMAVRRVIPLVRIIAGDPTFRPDVVAEYVALAISVLMVIGIARIAPVFSSIRRSEKAARQAEKDMEESRTMYRTLAENLPGIVYRVHVREDNRMQFFNTVAERVTGYAETELAARGTCSIRPLVLAEDRDTLRAALTGALTRREPYSVEYRLRRKDGGGAHVLEIGTPVFGPDGEPLYIDGVVFDITDRKQAEAALREGEDKVRLILESTGEAIYGIDVDGRCTFCNPALLRLLGYRRADDLLGKDIHDLIHHTRSDGTPYPGDECHILRAVRRREGCHCDDEVLWRADGTSFPAEYWAYPQVKGDDFVGAVVTFMDITERKSLENQFRQAQKMEAVGRLAGGIAHDFNNLLTATIGYCDLALGRIGNQDPVRSDLDEIRRASERCSALTRQLLAFSREQILKPRVINLNGVVADLDKMLRHVIGEDIRLVSALAGELGSVKVDPGQIEQVIMNLVVNSRDAMPGGGMLTITTANVFVDGSDGSRTRDVPPGSYVMLAVSDTGCGIDELTLTRIFDPFFTTKRKGTGLGLSTVYGIVKQSGGFVSAHSERGVGTTFKIYFPRVGDGAAEDARPDARPSENLRGDETILLVEDEDLVRQMIRESLASYGYTVHEACRGSEAVDLCAGSRETIHLMLTDVVMPGMSGVELAKRLTPVQPGLKVLFMSGYATDFVLQEDIPDPAVAFIQKPFTMDSLARKVRQVLGASV